MTECSICGTEYDMVKVEHGPEFDRGDGVMYGSCSYTSTPCCPKCGHNNGPRTMMLYGKI